MVLCVAFQSEFQYCQVALPRNALVPLLVSALIVAPLVWPFEASKLAVSTLISATVSVYGR